MGLTFLLDTNVVSEPMKPRPDPAVVAWLRDVGSSVRLSVMTLGEMRKGAERVRPKDDARAGHVDDWIATTVSRFADRILPVDVVVAEQWGRLDAVRPVPFADGLIAATALVHGLVVATRNVRDFELMGVAAHNPFGGSPTG